MAYNTNLAEKLRAHLSELKNLQIEEKKMFGGLSFMVNGKMCINVSGDNLMCRYDPERKSEISKKPGYKKLIMRKKELKGYCYVEPKGFAKKKEFEYWVSLCLDFNEHAKSSKKK